MQKGMLRYSKDRKPFFEAKLRTIPKNIGNCPVTLPASIGSVIILTQPQGVTHLKVPIIFSQFKGFRSVQYLPKVWRECFQFVFHS